MSSPNRQCDSGRSEALKGFQFLRVPEVARVLGVSRLTVFRLLRAGKLPGKKLGRLWLISGKGLAKYLRSFDASPGQQTGH